MRFARLLQLNLIRRISPLLLIAIFSVGQAAQASSFGCLQVGHNEVQAILNLDSGAVRQFTLPYFSGLNGGFDNVYLGFVFSPDHRNAAYVQPDARVGDAPPLGTLFISPVNAYGELGQAVSVLKAVPVPVSGGNGGPLWAGGTEFPGSTGFCCRREMRQN